MTTTTTPLTPSYHQHPVLVRSFCTMRAERMAREIHAFTRIPLREAQIEALGERMLDVALLATSDDDVTTRVNGVQDAFVDGIRYRTPRMWRICREAAVGLMDRIGDRLSKGPKWRLRKSRSLCRRMFYATMDALDDTDANSRLRLVQEAAIGELLVDV